ncbi:MAG: D-allose transporter substrate-binding protein [Clostridia bacterium]|nr:D-allose transporter substrate-binding protein [Lachnospiraceae bacterium]NCC01374.1 D-allose transporter substrate-binding protein [Clostridia bacterium]NCD02380.1 D-allose transporter substrate-binding protein [Clostridia bacterium]
MKKRIVALALTMSMVVAALVGCGSSTKETKAETKAETAAAGETTAEATGDAEYAVILKTQASDFWVKMWKGVEEKAAEMGIKVDIYAAQNEEDTEGQLAILESCINKGYKGIAIAPLSAVNLVAGVAEATEKGITIVDIDEKFDMDELTKQGGAVVGFVTTDNIAVGAKGAQYIIDNVDAGSQVAVIEGKAGNASGEDRRDGATEAFKAAGLEVVGSLPADWDRQKALDIAASYIQQNPDLKGIYCCNDTMALGALQAVVNADKLGEILVVGTDGDTEAVDSVNAGNLSATVAQDPAGVGAKGLEMLVEAVKAGTKGEVGVIPEMTPVDSTLVVKE